MNIVTQEHSVVAVYESHRSAESAIKALHEAGFDMARLSIVGADLHTEEHAMGFYTAGDRVRFWGGQGALWGTLWGMLVGGAFFLVPTVGPLVVMGPMVAWVVTALEGAAVGGTMGVIAGALSSLGIAKDSVIRYELSVRAGKFLVIAHGTSDMIEHAHAVLGTTGAAELTAHHG